MSTSVANLIQTHLNDISVLENRISDFDKDTDFKQQRALVPSSKLNYSMPLSAWVPVVENSDLEKTLLSLNLDESLAREVLNYKYVNQLSKEEWKLLSEKDHVILNHLESCPTSSHEEIYELPLALYATKNKLFAEESIEIGKKIRAELTYSDINRDWSGHIGVTGLIELAYHTNLPIRSLIQLIALYKDESPIPHSDLRKLSDIIIGSKDQLDVDTFRHLEKGYQIVSSSIDENMLDDFLEKRKDTLMNDLITIGKIIKTDTIPKNLFMRFFHHSGDVFELLFPNHQSLVKKAADDYESTDYSRYHYEKKSHRSRVLQLIQKAIFHKKKAFLRLFEEDETLYAQLNHSHYETALYSKRFFELVNLNTLSIDNVLEAASTRINEKQFTNIGEITYQEFALLNVAKKLHHRLYTELQDIKMDQRMKILKNIPNVYWKRDFVISENDFVNRLLDASVKTNFKDFKTLSAKYNVTETNALYLHLFPERFQSVLDEIKTDTDVELLMKYDLRRFETLIALKNRVYQGLEEIENLKSFIGADNDFYSNNINQLYHFYEKGLAKIVRTYSKSLESSGFENLRLLTKAEIAGKLKTIKFRDEDFAKEIGYAPSRKQRDEWRHDRSLKDRFTFTESSDFGDSIQMGEIPTHTCQSWDTGSYKHCLLSIFDLNKKLIIVRDKGKIVARAIVRLTKMNPGMVGSDNELGFIDIESLSETNTAIHENKEKLVLFVERFYTTYTGSKRTKITQGIVELVKQKAKEMNVDILLTDYYKELVTTPSKNIPIYISRSKNSKQYLDSLGGEAKASDGGKYHSASVYHVRLT